MKSCLIFCSETLLEAEKGREAVIKFYESHPTEFDFAIEIAKATIDVMYPYWLGILADEKLIDEIDRWLYEGSVKIPSGEVCVGIPRLWEFENYAVSTNRYELSKGKAKEVAI